MVHTVWNLAGILNFLHIDQIISHLLPEDLEVGVLVRRLLEHNVANGHLRLIVLHMVNLHLQHQDAQISLVWDRTLYFRVLNVLAVQPANREQLVRIAGLGLLDDWFIEEFPMMNVDEIVSPLECSE